MFLVTGATGFIGSAVVRRLLARHLKVRVLLRPSSDRSNICGLDVNVVEGDLLCSASIRSAVKGCEGVFHVAADYRLWTPSSTDMFMVNVDGTRCIIEAAIEAQVPKIVYTSSVAVLGNDQNNPSDEDTPVSYQEMIGAYKKSKFRAEEAVQKLIEDRDAPVVIVNPSTPIGPRDIKPTPTGRVILEAACGRVPAYVDTGLNVAHVDDVAEGHLLAFDRGLIGERYVLGGDDMTLANILAVVASKMNRKPPRICLPHLAVIPIAYVAEAWTRLTGGCQPFVTVDGVRMARKKMFFSSAKAERDLGYTHRPSQEAINDAINWFHENGYLI